MFKQIVSSNLAAPTTSLLLVVSRRSLDNGGIACSGRRKGVLTSGGVQPAPQEWMDKFPDFRHKACGNQMAVPRRLKRRGNFRLIRAKPSLL